MRARIDISEVETRTKIRAKYLRAIENEEWDLLPGPVYVKSFLRTYGDFLGLDSRMLVDEFKRTYERAADHDHRPIGSISRERERPPRGPMLPPWAVIGLVLVAIVVALYIVGNANNAKPPPTGARANKGKTHTHAVTPKRHVTVVLPVKPKKVSLQLVPTSTVYVCLVDARGIKLIDERTFAAGETIPTETGTKLLLTLGNASVQMKVDGNPVTVNPSPTAIRYLLTPTGVKMIPFSTTPTCP